MSFNISIPKPCSENWDNFEKRGNNGFCLSCQKDVVDFTQYSDQEITRYFKKNALNKTCGRFKAVQLKTYTLPKKKRDFGVIASLLTAGILTISSPSDSKANPQGYEAATSVDEETGNKIAVQTSAPDSTKHWIEIRGKVILDEDDTALPAVNVVVKGTDTGTTTDSEGNFLLNYDADKGEKIIVTFSYIGLTLLEKEVALSKASKDIGTVAMSMDVTGGICVHRWYSPRRWWEGITSLFN